MSLGNLVRASLLFGVFSAVTMASSLSIVDNTSSVFFEERPDTNSTVRALGQTFILPTPTTDNVLDNFSFYFASTPSSDFSYRGYVFEFNTGTSQITGPALFSSSLMIAGTPSFTGLSVTLTPGTTYLALLTTGNADGSDTYSGGVLSHNSGTDPGKPSYPDGQAYLLTSTDPTGADLTTATWSLAYDTNSDFKFTAEFVAGAAVPEPSTLGFGFLGLLLTAAGVRRRRAR